MASAMASTMANWVTDRSPGFSIEHPEVKHAHNPRESKRCNAIWQEGNGVSSGEHYWRIHFLTLEGVAGVGFTSLKHFKPGYECKALQFLGGDLNNGAQNGVLVPNFGPRLEEGDVVGILAVFEEKKLKVYFDINGDCLGLAFAVSDTIFESIVPMVTFFDAGSAICTKQTEIPSEITYRDPPRVTGIEGFWKLISWEENNKPHTISRRVSSRFSLVHETKCGWNSKVAKSFRTVLNKHDGVWVAGGIITDKVKGDPEAIRHEDILIRLIPGVKKIENIDGDDGRLLVASNTISSTWKRYDATPGPFVGDPFGRD